jgi:DNA-binding CsgD family transcriptional regulator
MDLLRQLSARELTFLNYCCSEMTYKEIADVMEITSRTVDGYREALFAKLNIKSRIGLVIFAIKTGVYKIQ